MILSTLLVLALQAGDERQAAHPLDMFMRDVTEACLLPDLEKHDPRVYFAKNDWVPASKGGTFTKQIADANYSVLVRWPATNEAAAACTFETYDVKAYDAYDWFRKRIGEPQNIAWSERQVGGWKMTTNGHDAGVYVSRKHETGSDRVGMMLHILQN